MFSSCCFHFFDVTCANQGFAVLQEQRRSPPPPRRCCCFASPTIAHGATEVLRSSPAIAPWALIRVVFLLSYAACRNGHRLY